MALLLMELNYLGLVNLIIHNGQQSHATEPAVGSVLKSTHLAPAR